METWRLQKAKSPIHVGCFSFVPGGWSRWCRPPMLLHYGPLLIKPGWCLVLSDEQMSNGWSFSPLNGESWALARNVFLRSGSSITFGIICQGAAIEGNDADVLQQCLDTAGPQRVTFQQLVGHRFRKVPRPRSTRFQLKNWRKEITGGGESHRVRWIQQ